MTPLGLVVLGVFGLMIGSFLNVCISRLPAGESVIAPGSHCRSCGTPIRWFDNVPVLSYLLLGGRCRSCRAPIGWRYPVIEVGTGVAFVLQGVMHGDDLPVLVSRLVLTALLVALFGTDLETQRLPNLLTLPGTVVGFLFSLWVGPGAFASLAGMALGAGMLFFIRWAWFRATGVEGMGLGDVKMAALIGAFLGARQTWLVLVLASIGGAAIGVAIVLFRGRSLDTRIPFGTFLAIATLVASLAGDAMVSWYFDLYR
ncbi:MAG TPA: prepilin peptidase [Vicinamibacterales bacterium]|nr:prepilin peptidase [Vicinamibacterales bacterium]